MPYAKKKKNTYVNSKTSHLLQLSFKKWTKLSENSKGLKCQPHSWQVYIKEASSNLNKIYENKHHHQNHSFLPSSPMAYYPGLTTKALSKHCDLTGSQRYFRGVEKWRH